MYICALYVCILKRLNDGYIIPFAHDEPASPKPVATAISSAHQVLLRVSPWSKPRMVSIAYSICHFKFSFVGKPIVRNPIANHKRMSQ